VKFGRFVSDLIEADVALWKAQQSVTRWATNPPETKESVQEHCQDLNIKSAERDYARALVDQCFQDETAPPRQGCWIRGYSQFGEQVDIHDIFRGQMHGYAVDVGACDGISRSNTKQLEDRGWDVLCIEANPGYEAALKTNRKNCMIVACGAKNKNNQDFHIFEAEPGLFEALSSLKPAKDRPSYHDLKPSKVVKVPVRTLDWCLKEANFPRLDMLSIDVEGGEAEVLDGFSIAKWRPKMIILEDWKGGQFTKRLGKHGYWLKNRLGVNEVFIHE